MFGFNWSASAKVLIFTFCVSSGATAQLATENNATKAAASIITIEAEEFANVEDCSVETSRNGYSGSGYVNYGSSGSWAEWIVEADTAGLYALFIRYAVGDTNGRPSELFAQGAKVLGNLAFAYTGAWDAWDDESKTAHLTGGNNTIRIKSIGSGPNIDLIQIQPAASSAAEQPSNNIHLAIDYTSQNDCDLRTTYKGYSSTAYMDYGSSGAFIEWDNVDVDRSGEYELRVRYTAGDKDGRRCDLLIQGSKADTLEFEYTGSWRTWAIESVLVALQQGSNRVQIRSVGDGPNLDFIQVVYRGGRPGSPLSGSSNASSTGASISGTLSVAPSLSLSSQPATIPSMGPTLHPSALPSVARTKGVYASTIGLSVKATYQAEDYTNRNDCSLETDNEGYTGRGYMDYGNGGAWVEWDNINTDKAGQYLLTVRYAVGDENGRQCEVFVQGANSGTLEFAYTGDWRSWEFESILISLQQGNNNVRITSTGAGPNLDFITVELVPTESPTPQPSFKPTLTSIPLLGEEPTASPTVVSTKYQLLNSRYEAEDYTSRNDCDMDTSRDGYSGTGFMDYGGSGAFVEWDNVLIPKTGKYRLIMRYAANDEDGRNCELFVQGVRVGPIPFADTGDWDAWMKETKDVDLEEGNNLVRIQSTGAGPNLDYMELEFVPSGLATGVRSPTAAPSDAVSTSAVDDGTDSPSMERSNAPSPVPSTSPSLVLSNIPTTMPSDSPTTNPSLSPSKNPITKPSTNPTPYPSSSPSREQTSNPTSQPTFGGSFAATIRGSLNRD